MKVNSIIFTLKNTKAHIEGKQLALGKAFRR